MANKEDYYIVEVLEAHMNWGTHRNPTHRAPIEGESYVKIPSRYARQFEIIRETQYTAHFANGMSPIKIKASGNGPSENGVQYAKQFEGVGLGACKAFTPWYIKSGIQVGDKIKVKFISSVDILFTKV